MGEFFMNAADACDDLLIGAKLRFRKHVVEPVAEALRNEDGDIVQTVIILAIFATLAVVVVTTIGTAIKGKADDVQNAIEGLDPYK